VLAALGLSDLHPITSAHLQTTKIAEPDRQKRCYCTVAIPNRIKKWVKEFSTACLRPAGLAR
jgi:hypothetical protein